MAPRRVQWELTCRLAIKSAWPAVRASLHEAVKAATTAALGRPRRNDGLALVK